MLSKVSSHSMCLQPEEFGRGAVVLPSGSVSQVDYELALVQDPFPPRVGKKFYGCRGISVADLCSFAKEDTLCSAI